MTTFPQLMATELRREPGRPLLTWYDEGTGERVELSVTTYANWVAKTASLLVDEHDLERGDVLLVDLPAHWLGPVFLGAAWTAGLAVAFPCVRRRPGSSGLRPRRAWRRGLHARTRCRCWPARCCRWASGSPSRCPPACTTSGWRCGGSRTRSRRTTRRQGADVALVDGPVTQDELFGSTVAAGSSSNSTGGDRLLSAANPASPPGVAALSRPLVSSGSLVLVTGADPARLDAIAEAERVTRRFG